MNGKYGLLTLLFSFLPILLFARQDEHAGVDLRSAKFLLVFSDTSYQLPREFIVENSERVFVDSTGPLRRSLDYSIDYRYGLIRFSARKLHQLLSDSQGHVLAVSFHSYPFQFKKEYALRQLSVVRDSTGRKKVTVSQPSTRYLVDDFFGSGLQKSGSITRGFTVGTNHDLSLSSGFRMQLAGKLSRDVDVVAALTDENSPIQPEGTTQTLREVDKVFVELKSSNYTATLGDFNYQIGDREGGEFGRLLRKVQGANGVARFDHLAGTAAKANVSLTGATARGKYQTNQFQGIEGSQGPYRLTGRNGEQRLIVIAGSERVYLNGELMSRGELNDYTIEYASGEVTFTSKRLITNASRITVDFEYSDRQFTRNLVAGGVTGISFGSGTNFNISFDQEADDPDSPIDVALDDTTRRILRQSGSDRFKASVSGIRLSGRDSTGLPRGVYVLRDSVINARQYSILVYAPGDSFALYNATFSPVDAMPPDSAGYIRIAAGNFQFAGIGQGNFLPVQFLPMPQLHRLFDVNGTLALIPDLEIGGEFASSQFEPNRFSPSGDNTAASARKISATYRPRQLLMGGSNLGELELRLSDRFVDKRFVAPDRLNEVEFDRKWNLENSLSTDEEISEGSIQYRPLRTVLASVNYGRLNRPGDIQSTRIQTDLGISDSSLPEIHYRRESIDASSALAGERSSWVRQRGTAQVDLSPFTPSFRVESEERLASPVSSDSMKSGSFRFLEFAPEISSREISRMTTTAELQFRTEDSAATGLLRRASTSLTQIYTWRLAGWQSLSSSLALSIRNTEFTDEFKSRGNLNTEVILVRSQSRFTPLQRAVESDFYYEFASQRSARLERIFVRVAQGTGNYRYKGDLNGNGVAEENEFELTRFDGDYIVLYLPSDRLEPVVDLKSSIRIRLQPARILGNPSGQFERILKAVSTETYARVDEKSTESDSKQIYLLNFNRFQDSRTTISGSNQLTQDLYLFENDPNLSFRFRFDERKGLLQLVSSTERSYLKERSIRVRSQLVPEFGNQTDFASKNDRVLASIPSSRERDLESNALGTEFSYRPEQQLETAITLGVTRVANRLNGQASVADINEQGTRVVYGLPNVGQLRAELKREEVTLNNVTVDPLRPLPFEFTNGKAIGKTFLWQFTFDYRINQNVQVSMNYNGRTEGGGSPIHTARVEARAFF